MAAVILLRKREAVKKRENKKLKPAAFVSDTDEELNKIQDKEYNIEDCLFNINDCREIVSMDVDHKFF